MPRVVERSSREIKVGMSGEEQIVLCLREKFGSWRNVWEWLRREVPHRMSEIGPVLCRSAGFERWHAGDLFAAAQRENKDGYEVRWFQL